MNAVADDKRIGELHFENQLWVKEIGFYALELDLMKKRLADVVARNTNQEMLAKAESYQNKFIRQAEVNQSLTHRINEHEAWLSKYAEANPVAIDKVRFADHATLRDEMETYKKLYAELKGDFMRWLTNWM